MNGWEQELQELKARVEHLEMTVRRLAGDESHVAKPVPENLSEQEQVLAWLKAEGVVREPTPQERHLAAEWETLPEEEKEAHIRFMHGLALDTPLSQVILENRR